MNRTLVLRSPGERLALRLPLRTVAVVGGLLALLTASAFASLCLGSHPTDAAAVWHALIGPGDGELSLIVREIRLPRILLAILVGAALGAAGLLFQGLVRNPLASPDVIGVTTGASAGAVLMLVLGVAGRGSPLLPAAAIAGAFLVAVCILVLAWGRRASPGQLILVGVGIASALGALITLMLVMSPDTTAMNAYLWLAGSLYAAQWGDVAGLLPWLAVCLPLALGRARHLDVMAMGDDVATGLGSALHTSRLILLLCGVVLSGTAVAFAGGLSFIGLVAPHIARNLVRSGSTALTAVAAMVGGLILLYADLVGRIGFLPRDLPAGIFVAGIGAPFFVYQLHRLRR
ncbi:putative siderophore transport system permease protein YfhA [wastewater metagenome]|uniref:Putative siderophore transport system permease protein YfhA n=2 Tax=unclassified sequences TaxID=12908 RepID=A0A5B8RDW0_9ZZZZ|nr:iron ABC transporter permease [Arhodomonas sp. KWT]QEA06781.1 putative siderophore transport system permease protein YfhA [uncultured organism]